MDAIHDIDRRQALEGGSNGNLAEPERRRTTGVRGGCDNVGAF